MESDRENGLLSLVFQGKKTRDSIFAVVLAFMEILCKLIEFVICFTVIRTIIFVFFFPRDFLRSKGSVEHCLQNSSDVTPTLLGCVFAQLESTPLSYALLYTVLQLVFFVGWFTFTHSAFLNVSKQKILQMLGITKVLPSKIVVVVLLSNLAAFLFLMRPPNSSFFSLSNFLTDDGKVDFMKTFDALIFAPVQEEFFHRFILFTVIHNRLSNPIVSIGLTNFFFAFTHVFGTERTIYSLLQFCGAFLIGCFYSLRFYRTQSIWEPIYLHVINNTFSIFVDKGISWSGVVGTNYFLSAVGGILLYAVLLAVDVFAVTNPKPVKIQNQKKKKTK